MANVTPRLQLCFGPSADLKMERSTSGTRVHFSVPRRSQPRVWPYGNQTHTPEARQITTQSYFRSSTGPSR